jgi:hypothetical protein
MNKKLKIILSVIIGSALVIAAWYFSRHRIGEPDHSLVFKVVKNKCGTYAVYTGNRELPYPLYCTVGLGEKPIYYDLYMGRRYEYYRRYGTFIDVADTTTIITLDAMSGYEATFSDSLGAVAFIETYHDQQTFLRKREAIKKEQQRIRDSIFNCQHSYNLQ